ncbi:hypothetical protein [Nocardioides sp. KR10-350]|uniref:hypothetical protein n=1 Tax=Nocardioides cheoyonin TaxID=3156615 RepID=UPI0032B4E585
MFGRLPVLHQALVVVTSLVVGVLAGLWVAHFTALQVAGPVGAGVGGVVGVLTAYALVHERHRPHAHRLRVRRH